MTPPPGHSVLLVAVVVLPLVTALLIPAAGRIRAAAPYYLSCAVTFSCLVITGFICRDTIEQGTLRYWLGGWEPPFGIEYAVDHLNAFVMVVVATISFLITVYSRKSLRYEIEAKRLPLFYCIYILFYTGLMGMVITGDIFNLYVFIEITSLSGYALIAMGTKRDALMASYKYLILGTIAATFILIGIGYIYMATGTLNMADLKTRLEPLYHSKVIRTAFAFFTVGLSLKLALFPLHIWLPDAYAHAPSAVSALMAATGTKVGAYTLLRTFYSVFTVDFDIYVVSFTAVFAIPAVLAVVVGSVLAVAQTNLKKMLAYSSVGQIGYIALGISLSNEAGLTGSIMHILNHALMKGTLFLAAGALIFRGDFENIAELRGLGRKMPWTMAAFTVAGLSMVGVPLTVGFVSKWYLVVGAAAANRWDLAIVIIASSLLTAVYFWRIIESVYAQPDPEGQGESDVQRSGGKGRETALQRELPLSMLIPMLVMAGACVACGIWATPSATVAGKAALMLLGR